MNINDVRRPLALEAINIISVADTGSASAVAETDTPSAQNLVEIDFNSAECRRIESFLLKGFTINGQGATPTSPGAGKKIYLNWYWSDAPVALADVYKILAGTKTSANVTLPDSSATNGDGQRHWHFTASPLQVLARYLYVGVTRDAFASANSKIDLVVSLVRPAQI